MNTDCVMLVKNRWEECDFCRAGCVRASAPAAAGGMLRTGLL